MLQALGFRFLERSRAYGFELRFSWAEITGNLGLALGLHLFEDHYSLHVHLGWPNVYFRLKSLDRWLREPHEGMESWGFSVHRSDVHFRWGRKYKIVHFPWAWEWVRTSIMLADGTWCHETRERRVTFPNYPLSRHEKRPWGSFNKIKDELAWSETYPFRYVLRDGTVQDRDATLKVEEREWRWLWFTWLPFPRMVRRSIDVAFSDEVGERTGSWKGGTVGCGYDLRHDEMPREALARMQRERKFR
ncbi:hypothetical protein ACRQ5Q_24350 [Bradyrhizobium sp. PMVTL-01]|uniref:hypothetical protein n=1 Tax=Bradyrhizobium sp. PMVTL-01 TaxID=3434999 RepID=UPI003F72D69A